MKILNTLPEKLTFQDIVDFCKEGQPEGVQIDYKKDFPEKGFSKFFASFSNTRGGVIIIGVEEDKKTGIPVKWEGVTKDAKQIEKIHQAASNVQPIPSYIVQPTDEIDGKCFVIVRISEGDKTPYYVQNDSNVWVRTGNISNPIDIASPDWLELLFGKVEKARKSRDFYLNTAQQTFQAGLERAENERLVRLEEEKRKEDRGDVIHFSKQPLGTDLVLCETVIQPYYPHRAIASPQELYSALGGLRLRDFPDLNMEAVPEGIFKFIHRSNGYIECQQVFGTGLIYSKQDVSRVESNGIKTVGVSFILGRVFSVLQFAKAYYNRFGYHGVLTGYIKLDGMKGVYTKILKSGGIDFDDDESSLLPNYLWKIEIDTNILNNPVSLRSWVLSLTSDIYWSFGYKDSFNEDRVDKFLENNNLSF